MKAIKKIELNEDKILEEFGNAVSTLISRTADTTQKVEASGKIHAIEELLDFLEMEVDISLKIRRKPAQQDNSVKLDKKASKKNR